MAFRMLRFPWISGMDSIEVKLPDFADGSLSKLWYTKSTMSEKSDKLAKSEKDKDAIKMEAAYAKTRKSLIARLDNWEDQRTWDEFYKTYWKLIYAVGLKAGLRSDEAFDVVQETILSIAKQSKKNMYY